MGFAGLGNMALSAADARAGFLTDLAQFKEQIRLQHTQMLQDQANRIKQERAQRAAAKKEQQRQNAQMAIAAAGAVATGGLSLLASPALAAPAAAASSIPSAMSLQNMIDNGFKVGLAGA